MTRTALHLSDALRLLKDGEPHRLQVLKLSTGELLTYEGACFQTSYETRGMITVRLPQSSLFRSFRTVALMEIDHLKIYL